MKTIVGMVLVGVASVALGAEPDVSKLPPVSKKTGVTSNSRFGWNASGRAGRTWCIVRMQPTPPNSGRIR